MSAEDPSLWDVLTEEWARVDLLQECFADLVHDVGEFLDRIDESAVAAIGGGPELVGALLRLRRSTAGIAERLSSASLAEFGHDGPLTSVSGISEGSGAAGSADPVAPAGGESA